MATAQTSSPPPFGPDYTQAPARPDRCVPVLLPLPLAGAYDYLLPDGIAHAAPGTYVRVPLGARDVIGVIWERAEHDTAKPVPVHKLRSISEIFPVPPMPEASRRLVEWVAAYTLSPPGAVLRMAVNVPSALEAPKPMLAYRRTDAAQDNAARLTPARRRVLELLDHALPMPPGELAREAGCSPAVVRGMADAGLLEPVHLPPRSNLPALTSVKEGPLLSAEQDAAAEILRSRVTTGGYSSTVLDGVTGSGKTEVYLEAVAAAVAAGRQVLVLVPEIALTPQMLDRFVARFGVPPQPWHSELTGAQRRETWRAVAEGRSRIVVGARSALFLPFPDLGLIVVDEEHETAFKQEDGVPYHGRDMAVVRAHLGKIPIILVSATPSLESVINAESGRYTRVHLPERHGGASMPEVALVDLRREKPPRGGFLAPPLRAALAETLAAGEQALLFLNRRGYAPLTLCRSCGHRIQCPNCTAWLVEHRYQRRLQCHHCGFFRPSPKHCPSCDAEDSLVACGPGVERITEEVTALLPTARVVEMTSDTLSGPAAMQALVQRIHARDVDIIIGTQVVAKGHHFPLLTLVGVVDGDIGLAGGDLRAAERTFQMLHQVAGRAGRADRPGRVMIQTWQPEHPVMQALLVDDRDGFLQAEANARADAGMPPYGRLAALIVSGADPDAVDNTARALARAAPDHAGALILGPAPAPLALLRGQHRRRFLIKAERTVAMQALLSDWLARVTVPHAVRVQVDIDPYSFL
jgi:primosomal protein N' (replication factor Y) (superfamily II helicase)